MESNMALNFFKGIQLWHTEFQSKQTLIVTKLEKIGYNFKLEICSVKVKCVFLTSSLVK